ncbi:MAG TPA: nitroreductase family protein [Bacillota bacterium]|nr:nitroreductase family protein [Bacillota bacterium]
MEFSDLVKMRQSVREYSDKPVDQYKITRCLDAARLAPSACNYQPWTYLVVDEPQLKDEIAKNTFGTQDSVPINRFTLQAPVLILILTEKLKFASRIKGFFNPKPYEFYIDIGITASYFCLRAVEEGLGTCTLGRFDERKIKTLLNLPSSKKIALIISVGYPKSNEIRPKVRKRLDQIVKYNHMEGSDENYVLG